MKQFNVQLPDEWPQIIRIKAAEDGVSVSKWVEKALFRRVYPAVAPVVNDKQILADAIRRTHEIEYEPDPDGYYEMQVSGAPTTLKTKKKKDEELPHLVARRT